MTREAINELKKYTLGKKNTEKVEISVLQLNRVIKALEQESCEDTISRKSIKQKLQEHHDFFVNAYGGFSNLPQNDKSRVDEITNCIAMVVNEPSVTPQEPIHGKCNQCKYYEGVHNIQGHAPCTYHRIGGVMWDWYCSQFDGEIKE